MADTFLYCVKEILWKYSFKLLLLKTFSVCFGHLSTHKLCCWSLRTEILQNIQGEDGQKTLFSVLM